MLFERITRFGYTLQVVKEMFSISILFVSQCNVHPAMLLWLRCVWWQRFPKKFLLGVSTYFLMRTDFRGQPVVHSSKSVRMYGGLQRGCQIFFYLLK